MQSKKPSMANTIFINFQSNQLFLCLLFLIDSLQTIQVTDAQSREGTPYNGLYGEAPPERGTLFRLQVYKGAGISQSLGIKKSRKIGHLGNFFQ